MAKDAGLADLVSSKRGAVVAVTVAEAGGEVTVAPFGVEPRAVAVLWIEPRSMSACVLMYDAVQTADPPGTKVVAAQVGAATPVNIGSLMARLEMVVWPELVTVKV